MADERKDPVIGLADCGRRSAPFARIRRDHRTEVAEDYVEMIADLIDTDGEARIVDLAARFGVSSATVNNTVARLRRDGFVEAKPYRSIFLTAQGRALAEACRHRHRIVLGFLYALGVSRPTAEADAEGIEHHVSDETLEAMRQATEGLARSGRR
jgi:DtxR family manganese transport transcriptional regulator